MSGPVLTESEAGRCLEQLGFNVGSNRARLRMALTAFKTVNLHDDLRDHQGQFGPALGRATSRALTAAVDRINDPAGTMSPHFNYAEARCKCGGRYTGCLGIWATRGSVRGLERLRGRFYPGGLHPVSWCRCVGHNRYVGGATSSRHLKGDAVDIPHTIAVPKIVALGQYGGIGIARSDKRASHVDLRPGSTARPTMWWYGNQ